MGEPRWKRWGLIFGAWTLLGLLTTTRIKLGYAYAGNPISWRVSFIIAYCDWYVWAALFPLMLWLARRCSLEAGRRWRFVLLHLPLSVLLCLLKIVLDFSLRRMLAPNYARRIFLSELSSVLFTYWAIVGVVYAFDYYRKYREHQLKASQLETQLAQAQLEALKMQLQPHFLFNTLHAISSLMHRDVEAADRMLARLSDLLRLTLENAGAQEVTLRQELEFLERYLEIEQTRFRDRLRVRMEIEPETLDARVPNLILQPLVENAIRHGIAARAAASSIEIRATRANGSLLMQVRDDGPGLQAEIKEGVGLANTRARLAQLYGAAQRFELSNVADGGLLVSLTLPFRITQES
jgi:two-component system, LytTR family, sensor kinase